MAPANYKDIPYWNIEWLDYHSVSDIAHVDCCVYCGYALTRVWQGGYLVGLYCPMCDPPTDDFGAFI